MLDGLTARDIITLVGFLFLLWNQNRTAKKDVEEKTGNWVKVNLKLDTLCQSQTTIKEELREVSKMTAGFETRISVLEEKVKVANKRLEDLERGA